MKLARRTRQQRPRRCDGGGGDRGQGRRAVLDALLREAALLRDPMAELVAVERLRRPPREIGMRQHARDRLLVGLAGRRLGAVGVVRLAGAQPDEIVDQRIAGPDVEGQRAPRRR